MLKSGIKLISDSMESLHLAYNFGEFNEFPSYPYFVGEYQEFESMNEDGFLETSFMITGYSRNSWLELENAKDLIRKEFGTVEGKTVISESEVTGVYYSNAQIIPTGDAELKKIQINLDIIEWSE